MTKEAYFSKIISKRFPKVRDAFAGTIRKGRARLEVRGYESPLFRKSKKATRKALSSALIHPDVGAVFFGTYPILGFPTIPATIAYSAKRKALIGAAKKLKAAPVKIKQKLIK